jgi:hypothetical protein
LEVVGEIADEVKKEAAITLRIVTAVLMVVSLALSCLVLAVPLKRNADEERDKNITPGMRRCVEADH